MTTFISFFTTLAFLFILLMLCTIVELTFRRSTYYKITGNDYFQTRMDKGKYGEYLTWKRLKSYEADGGKFLFNCYLPKENGKTTEVDVILIHTTGIYVMESKNYSGWIFGKETDTHWMQTLPNGKGNTRKERFYNPIKQNETHIRWLKNLVDAHIPIYSIIVFSERCTLKDITVTSSDIKVIQRHHIRKTVKHIGDHSAYLLSQADVMHIYETLYPYTQISEADKVQHIDDISQIKLKSAHKVSSKVSTVPNTKSMSLSEDILTDVTKDQTATLVRKKHDKNQVCPRCGAELTLRTATKGAHSGQHFYGCSRFPKCRYRKDITAEPPSHN